MTKPGFQRHLACAPGEAARFERRNEVVGFTDVTGVVYGGKAQIQNIEFSVNRGDFALVTGPIGSGKSSIHRTAAMIETPVSGQVRLFGEDVHAYTPKPFDGLRRIAGQDARSRKCHAVARMFQERIGLSVQKADRDLKSGWTVFENMVHYSEITGSATPDTYDRASDMLRRLGLSHKADQITATLSGGEQQKIVLGSLLVPAPELLLLDEPTAAMDVHNKEATLAFLQGLTVERDMTIMMISHDAQALNYTNHQIHVQDGRVIADQYVKPAL